MSRFLYNLSLLFLMSGMAFGQAVPHFQEAEWWSYGHDPGGMRFSPLTQINPSNVQLLQRAWTYRASAGP